MDASHKGTLYGWLNPGRPRTLSCLDEVGAGVQLRPRFTNLANENMYSAKGDPVSVLDWAGLGAPSFIVDVELATTTLVHPANRVPFESLKVSLQELKTIM